MAEALAKIKTLKPQVAVVDLDLPGTDGLELTRALQKLQPPIPTIIFTMHKEERMVMGALDCGAKGYILKDDLENIRAVIDPPCPSPLMVVAANKGQCSVP
jgi:DNA-binding NarL/FixJ family response regulator